jgi:hypothetical protein
MALGNAPWFPGQQRGVPEARGTMPTILFGRRTGRMAFGHGSGFPGRQRGVREGRDILPAIKCSGPGWSELLRAAPETMDCVF